MGGIFLHETFKVASMDDELMINTRMRAKRKFERKMDLFFKEADTNKDGFVSLEEFKEMLKHERVAFWLKAMEFDTRNPEAAFRYIVQTTCQDDHNLDVLDSRGLDRERLMKGVGLVRGGSHQLDLLALADQV